MNIEGPISNAEYLQKLFEIETYDGSGGWTAGLNRVSSSGFFGG